MKWPLNGHQPLSPHFARSEKRANEVRNILRCDVHINKFVSLPALSADRQAAGRSMARNEDVLVGQCHCADMAATASFFEMGRIFTILPQNFSCVPKTVDRVQPLLE